jgi:hypothetical protein
MSWWSSLLGQAPGRTRQASSAGRDDRGPDWLGFRPHLARTKRILLEPGETHSMADLDGPGMITRIWMTTPTLPLQSTLRDVVLRFSWDGESHPSVECSFGDFFGASFDRARSYVSAPLSITSGGFNCLFPMPYATGAHLEITNEGRRVVDPFFYAVTYDDLAEPPPSQLRFHAQWRRERRTSPGHPYTILEATGQGHFVGVRLDMQNLDNWLRRPPTEAVFPYGLGMGMLEGQERIWVDDDQVPSVLGTGTEDYFNSGWYFLKGCFSAPTHGCTVSSWLTGRASAYRFDIHSPVPFQQRIRVTVDHGMNNLVETDYSSTAYWYQSEPHNPFPKLPPPHERAPTPVWQNVAQSSTVLMPAAAVGALLLRRMLRRGE